MKEAGHKLESAFMGVSGEAKVPRHHSKGEPGERGSPGVMNLGF